MSFPANIALIGILVLFLHFIVLSEALFFTIVLQTVIL